DALAFVERAESLGYRPPHLFELAGDCAYALEDFPRAADAYRAAMEPGATAVLKSKLGVAEIRAGHAGIGASWLEQALAQTPAEAEAYTHALAAQVYLDDLPAALLTLRRRLLCLGPDEQTYVRMAAIAEKMHQRGEMESILQEGLQALPEAPRIRDALFQMNTSGLPAG
ncbi:MAG: hypothetical protein ACRELF_14355, partial [Gemmataceae bacterium]